jgi:hypothetical protein
MTDTDKYPELTHHERDEVVEILRRRANDVATFKKDLERAAGDKIGVFPGSVEFALSREVDRLRLLAGRVEVAGRSEAQIEASMEPLEVSD